MQKEIMWILALWLSALGAPAAPETLRFEGSGGDFFVKIDYGRAPDRVPPPGTRWSDFEKDSAWADTMNGAAAYHLRYVHVFFVSQGGENGVGFDRIRYDYPGAAEASFTLLFLNGNKETVYTAYDSHFKPRNDLDPAHNPGFEIGSSILAQSYENFLPTADGRAIARARVEGFDARLGPGPFRGRDVCRK
jgi:hypothetical protein